MKLFTILLAVMGAISGRPLVAADSPPLPPAFPIDPAQDLERTSFQTSQSWSRTGNLPTDVAMVYGIDKPCPTACGAGGTADIGCTS